MMPLGYAGQGEDILIRKVSGTPEMKKHLEDLGFCAGGTVRVLSRTGENLIVLVKGTRFAINKETAQKIMV